MTLVLLPGLDGTGELFANLLPELPNDMNVIRLAYPARRFLTYSELVVWLSDLVPKNEPYALLAESYGTPLAVKFAATHPANLVAVILSAGFISNPVKKWGVLPKLLARRFFFRFRPPNFALRYFILGSSAPESLKLVVERAKRSVSAGVLAARARATLDCDATQEILQVRVPLLYLQGSQDKLVAKECLDEIKRLHPQTVSISVPAPHTLLQQQPRIAAQAIAQFLEHSASSSTSADSKL